MQAAGFERVLGDNVKLAAASVDLPVKDQNASVNYQLFRDGRRALKEFEGFATTRL